MPARAPQEKAIVPFVWAIATTVGGGATVTVT